MLETVRRLATLLLVAGAVAMECMAVLGLFRFRYSLNRLHASGIGDTLGVLLMLLAAAVAYGISMATLKLLLILGLLWLTAPLSSHLIGQMVALTDEKLPEEAREWKS